MSTLRLPRRTHEALLTHLLGHDVDIERAAFVYARYHVDNAGSVFQYIDWHPVPEDGYLVQSGYHFELTDEARAAVIKRAHDLDASIVEFHSHRGHWPACFSPTDLWGLEEFVPHVWWRLKGRPYLAVVLTQGGFDALAWVNAPDQPEVLEAIDVEGTQLYPTGLSLLERHELGE